MSRISLVRTTVFRLAMLYAGLFSLLTALSLASIYWITTSQLSSQIDAGLRAEASALERLYQLKGIAVLRETIAGRSTLRSLAISNLGDAGPRQYLLTDPKLHPLAGTLSEWPAGINPAPRQWITLMLRLRHNDPGLDSGGRRDSVRAVTLVLRGGYHLLVGQSLNEIHEWRNGFLALTLAAIAFILIAGLAGGALMGGGVARRLEAVTRAADSIMAGDLSQRIPEEYRRDEFGALARKLNTMLARIEQLMQSTRAVTENVAHDLRSPLTRLRGRAEMALLKGNDTLRQKEALRKSIDDVDGIVATLNAILSIAQIESGARREWTQVDMGAVCRDAAELYEALAEDKGLEFTAHIADGLHVQGNRQLIAQAVGNLLDNAIKYTPAGGGISLTLENPSGPAVITVTDTGPGIPVDMRGKVLERFVRLDASRRLPGNGLGLSLVKAVADHHGAALSLADNRPGLRASLSFTGGNSI
ncbi:MAG: HAMP domain-containing histidine kinase [Gammaproteobacteria bacterium]|nr:HAMP domain-containing histidine kinase [Gammaproteobacteria bacterium]